MPAATPLVTYVLIGINVVMFGLQTVSADLQRELVLFSPAVADGEWYRLLTSAFLHYGVTHILFNMWALYVVGPPLEAALGRLRFIALYFMSALGGSVLVYLLSSLGAQTAGASGAMFGLFGATFVVGKRLNLDVRWVIGLIALNMAFTFVIPLVSSQNISWQGHIGGLVTGAAIAAAYAYAPRKSPHRCTGRGDRRGSAAVPAADLVAHSKSPVHVRRDLTGHDLSREIRPLLNLWSCVHVSVDM